MNGEISSLLDLSSGECLQSQLYLAALPRWPSSVNVRAGQHGLIGVYEALLDMIMQYDEGYRCIKTYMQVKET